jgi:hypothetical protein
VSDKRIAVTMIVCAALSAIVVTAVGAALTASEPPAQTSRPRPSPIPAATFLRGVIRLLAANEYASAWTSLDARQQLLVEQRAYVRCESLSAIPGRLDRIDVVDAHTERVVVPGSAGGWTRSSVITFRLTFAPQPSQRPVVVRVRAHALRSHGRWAWMLPAKRLALHRSGQCGTLPPHMYPDV